MCIHKLELTELDIYQRILRLAIVDLYYKTVYSCI